MLSVGIVGLPNVGKSTLFNALMKREIAKVGRHPFTTVTPNKGIVSVPDERLKGLLKMVVHSSGPGRSSASKVEAKPAAIEFVDIAGLVKGAAEGQGLGNKFLSHIREVDLILHALREFDNPQVAHVAGRIDPVADVATVDLELILADFEIVARTLEERRKKIRKERKFEKEAVVLEKVKKVLNKGKPAISAGLSGEEKKTISAFNLLTLKPVIFILNISEKHLSKKSFSKARPTEGVVLPICIKLASDLYQLDQKERQEYLDHFGIRKTGLEQIIKQAYKTLGLISFYTVKGNKIVTSWSIKDGENVLEAAETIHSDFRKRFVKAEVIEYERLIKAGSWQKAKEKGWLKLKGKDYRVKDGEVIEFRLMR